MVSVRIKGLEIVIQLLEFVIFHHHSRSVTHVYPRSCPKDHHHVSRYIRNYMNPGYFTLAATDLKL